VLDVLTHRSRSYMNAIEGYWRHFGDWDGVVDRIARIAPVLPRGILAYQPLGFGWILREVVCRITGMPVDRGAPVLCAKTEWPRERRGTLRPTAAGAMGHGERCAWPERIGSRRPPTCVRRRAAVRGGTCRP
jgi:hypothetical protein